MKPEHTDAHVSCKVPQLLHLDSPQLRRARVSLVPPRRELWLEYDIDHTVCSVDENTNSRRVQTTHTNINATQNAQTSLSKFRCASKCATTRITTHSNRHDPHGQFFEPLPWSPIQSSTFSPSSTRLLCKLLHVPRIHSREIISSTGHRKRNAR